MADRIGSRDTTNGLWVEQRPSQIVWFNASPFLDSPFQPVQDPNTFSPKLFVSLKQRAHPILLETFEIIRVDSNPTGAANDVL